MTIETARALEDAAAELGMELEVYEGYSGRGMFGDTTTGVVLDRSTDLPAICFMAGRGMNGRYEVVSKDLRNLRQDSMGLGVILY